MRAYYFFNKAVNSSLIAFIVTSVLIFFAEIFNLIGSTLNSDFEFVFSEISDLFLTIIPYAFAYFITLSIARSNRAYRGFFVVICLAVIYAINFKSINILFAILFTIGANYILNNFNKVIAYISSMAIAIILGLISFYLSDYFNNFLMLVAEPVSKSKSLSPFLFGSLNSLFKLIFVNGFEELFFYRSYGGSLIVNNEVVTGIKDMVQNGYDGKLVSSYMSGHYFVLFVLLGVALSLADELKGSQRIAMIITFALGILSGDISIILLFVFLESQYLWLLMVLISGFCYVISSMLDIGCSFVYNGGVIELLLNISGPIYLICAGLVFTAVGFFLTQLISLKFGISDNYNIYVPSRLNSFVNALGGIVNIVKIEDNIVEVRNSKLVNPFAFDCSIKENLVKTDDERLIELKEYL